MERCSKATDKAYDRRRFLGCRRKGVAATKVFRFSPPTYANSVCKLRRARDEYVFTGILTEKVKKCRSDTRGAAVV